jgi:PAS domain S-box-containing protein
MGAFERIFIPETHNAVKKLLAAIACSQQHFECETVNRTFDGRELHVFVNMFLPAQTMEFAGVIVSVFDLTDRKRSAEALCRSEDRFRTVFNHAASGMALVDQDGNYLRVNHAFSRMLGYTEQALMQMNWRDVTHPDDLRLTADMIAAVGTGSIPPPVEARFISRQGRIVWGLVNLAIFPDALQGPVYYIAQMQDISIIKSAQAKLEEREERYRKIFEADLSGICIVAPDGSITMCNLVFARMLGYDSAEEIMGQSFASFYRDPTLRPKIVADLTRNKKIEHVEAQFLRKDGSTIHVLINAIGRFDDYNRLVEMQGYILDITRLKNLESQLLHALKMESIGTMAGGVAHDFNNLLMGIMGNTSLLMADWGTEHPGYARLKNIQQYVQSGSELTRQLLGFAKGGRYEVRTIDINRLISRNITMFARTHKNIRVHTELASDLWSVEADRTQIDQVLYNLYVNALHAMDKGGDLFVKTANHIMDGQAAAPHGIKPGRFVVITVRDTGHGIEPEVLPRIFDPFFTTKERGRGTGLGLASAYGIVKGHGGFITVFSQPREGAAFAIHLPAAIDKEIQVQEMAVATALPNGGTGTILLVDDEEIIVDAIGTMISHLGYRLLTARSGAEALEIFGNHYHEIDLVILDMIMPGMGGGETFDKLKSIDPNVRVILCSGYSAEGQAADILQRGCLGFFQKPFTLNELASKLKHIFQEEHFLEPMAVD